MAKAISKKRVPVRLPRFTVEPARVVAVELPKHKKVTELVWPENVPSELAVEKTQKIQTWIDTALAHETLILRHWYW